MQVSGRCGQMLNNMWNSFNKANIITKSQMYELLKPCKVLCDNFAKTINYHGIHNNFCLDIPEIIEEEKQQQERREDIHKFTQLAMSDFENDIQDELVSKLLNDKDFMSEYETSLVCDLSTNERLLKDLGL